MPGAVVDIGLPCFNYWYLLAERRLDASGCIPFEIGGEWPVYRCAYPADLPEGAQLGYRFPAARAAANAPVDAWYAYERDRGVFSPLVLRTSDHVPVLTLQSRHIASSGHGERSENLAGVQLLGLALFAILTSLMESWRDWGDF